MIRFSEMVLPGHPGQVLRPDRRCGRRRSAYRVDPEAYAQIEIAVWSDQVWLTGGICTRRPLARTVEAIVRVVGRDIGYGSGNHIDADRYQISNTVCQSDGRSRAVDAPMSTTRALCIGWAGYDAATAWLPPEHFLAREFREALTAACRDGERWRVRVPTASCCCGFARKAIAGCWSICW